MKRFFEWLRSLFARKPKVTVYETPARAPVREPAVIQPTKAYADQRQKTKRNRRRKPSKAMRNLYKL